MSSAGASSRSFTTTEAPAAASLLAKAAPTPLPAPVTSAIFPSKFLMFFLLSILILVSRRFFSILLKIDF